MVGWLSLSVVIYRYAVNLLGCGATSEESTAWDDDPGEEGMFVPLTWVQQCEKTLIESVMLPAVQEAAAAASAAARSLVELVYDEAIDTICSISAEATTLDVRCRFCSCSRCVPLHRPRSCKNVTTSDSPP